MPGVSPLTALCGGCSITGVVRIAAATPEPGSGWDFLALSCRSTTCSCKGAAKARDWTDDSAATIGAIDRDGVAANACEACDRDGVAIDNGGPP